MEKDSQFIDFATGRKIADEILEVANKYNLSMVELNYVLGIASSTAHFEHMKQYYYLKG